MSMAKRRKMRLLLITGLCAAALSQAPAARAQDEPAQPPGQERRIQPLDEVFAYDADDPYVGLWVGELFGDQSTYVVLDIRRDDGGNLAATGMVELVLAVNAKASDVRIEDEAMALSIAGLAGRFSCLVKASENGQRLIGTHETTLSAGGERLGGFVLTRTVPATELPEPMAFAGELNVGMAVEMRFVFAETPAGNWVAEIDVPMQSVAGLPLVNVKREGQTITAMIPGANPATLTATLAEDEQSFTGVFAQSGMKFDVQFTRTEDAKAVAYIRPQEPIPPYPYIEREVTVNHPDGHILAGTLTLPYGDGPFAAAIMISGSGPQDRDEALLGHRPFLVIADFLTRHGIAVMRFDDRGINESTGNFSVATSADFATDVSAVMDHLKTIAEVDGERIGLIGHSEGGLIAPMVAAQRDDVAFIVLLAGPGVPGDEILKLQVELLMRAAGAAEEDIAAAQAQQAVALDLIRRNASRDEILEAMRPVVQAALAEQMQLEGEMLEQFVETQTQQLASPWMHYFVTHDPRSVLRKVKCPVLALNGTLDLQVWHEQNLPAIEDAIPDDRDLTVIRYKGLNHLFQPAERGTIGEYARIETTFDERVMVDIVDWIKSKAGDSPHE